MVDAYLYDIFDPTVQEFLKGINRPTEDFTEAYNRIFIFKNIALISSDGGLDAMFGEFEVYENNQLVKTIPLPSEADVISHDWDADVLVDSNETTMYLYFEYRPENVLYYCKVK